MVQGDSDFDSPLNFLKQMQLHFETHYRKILAVVTKHGEANGISINDWPTDDQLNTENNILHVHCRKKIDQLTIEKEVLQWLRNNEYNYPYISFIFSHLSFFSLF